MNLPPLFDCKAFNRQFAAAAESAGFTGEKFGEIDGLPLTGWHRRAAAGAPALYISSGMHGDEPAPPWALLQLMAERFFDARASWFICPLLNPTGFAQGTRTNSRGMDINRDYLDLATVEAKSHVAWLRRQPRFDATFCLHEDYDARGFYLYELNPENRPTLADVVLAAAAEHCPIEDGAIIDGRDSIAPGIIRPVSDPLLREQWPEAIYLRNHHTNLSYTFESPTVLPFAVRMAAQAAGLRAAIGPLVHRGG